MQRGSRIDHSWFTLTQKLWISNDLESQQDQNKQKKIPHNLHYSVKLQNSLLHNVFSKILYAFK